MKEIDKEIGNRIRRLRNAFGLKTTTVADVLGVSTDQYSKIEKGNRGLSSKNCIRLAEYYKVSCDYILRGVQGVAEIEFAMEKLDRLLHLTMQAKSIAEEIYSDSLSIKTNSA